MGVFKWVYSSSGSHYIEIPFTVKHIELRSRNAVAVHRKQVHCFPGEPEPAGHFVPVCLFFQAGGNILIIFTFSGCCTHWQENYSLTASAILIHEGTELESWRIKESCHLLWGSSAKYWQQRLLYCMFSAYYHIMVNSTSPFILPYMPAS